MAKHKVMLIDDDKEMLCMLEEILKENFDLEAFSDAVSAKEALRGAGEKPAVIITDVMMPGLDGYTFQNDLLANEKTRDIPVIVITAKSKMIDSFRDAPNVVGFLSKPFDVVNLLRMVGNAAERYDGPIGI